MKLRSMTGFARVRGSIAGLEVTIGVKSVNHRGLDLHFYASAELDPLESAMRSIVKRHTARGHLDVRVQLTSTNGTGALTVDSTRLNAYVIAFRAAASAHGLPGEPDLNAAFRIPGMLTESASFDLPPDFEPAFLALLEQALDTLNRFRAREGSDIGNFLLERNQAIYTAALKMEELRRDAQPAFARRLQERLSEILAGAALDPQRLAQEAAILADRGDIGEEIERLKIHSRQLEQILNNEMEAGKKLDFVLQEMNRETNTALSKTSGVGESGLQITELALSIKSDIEKLREQVLNLE